MPKFPIFAGLLLLSSFIYGQSDREVVQSCEFQRKISFSSVESYLTICSEDDQHSIEIKVSGKINPSDKVMVFDGDNKDAIAFSESKKLIENSSQVFKSTRLCLTVLAKLELEDSFLDLNGKCVAIDRSKWPVYQAISK